MLKPKWKKIAAHPRVTNGTPDGDAVGTSQTESSWGTHVSSEKEDPWVCGPTGSTNPGAASPNTLVMLVTWGTHLVIVYTMWNGFPPFIY